MATTATHRRALDRHTHGGVLPVLLAGTFMIVLDFFIVNVMLTSVQADLHASAGELEWVVSGYGLPFAVCLISAGRLGDRLGRRRVLAVGLIVFTAASVACAAAWSPLVLIVARIVQGLGAALISPNVLSIIGVLYTGGDRVRALRGYGLVMGGAAVGGQLLGGLLLAMEHGGLGWRVCFLVNVPVGVLTLLFVRRWVPESRGERAQRVDVRGMALVTAALTALVLPLVQGQAGLAWWAWVSLGCMPVLLGAFALHQRALAESGGSPLLDPRLLRERVLAAGLLTQVVFWCGQASFFLVLALYLQQGRGLSALQAGAVFAILAGAYLIASLRAPRLTLRLGRELVAVGALIVSAGQLLLLLAVWREGARGSVASLAPGLLLVGAGQGLCITPIASIVMSRIDPRSAGAASGLLSTMQQVGNSVGVAVTGLIFFGESHSGVAGAFRASVAQLAVLAAIAAALTRLLPAAGGATAARPQPSPALGSPSQQGGTP